MRSLTIQFIFILLSFSLMAQDNWELQKEKDGIKVYTSEVEGSDIRAYKAEAVMEGKLSSFVAALRDVDNFTELFESMKSSEIIESTDTLLIHYSQTNAPWPVKDRDGVYQLSFSQHHGTKAVRIRIKVLNNIKPLDDDYVRLEQAEGYWLLYPLDQNHVEVTYQMHAEPGGSLPAWVINAFIVDGPLDDMANLRERVKLDIYQNQKYDFLVE